MKDCQLNLNNCSGTVMRLLEYIFIDNNLYLISESSDVSLIDHLPYLILNNQENQLIAVLLVYDLLKILKKICQQELIV